MHYCKGENKEMDKGTRRKSSAEILREIMENSSTVIRFGLHIIQLNCVYLVICALYY